MVEYNFNKIEKKWQKAWETKKIFEVNEKSKKKKYYVLDMFPYPSGVGLHMGHAFVFSLGDIFARFKRAQGYNVLYPIGYDSLGLPAENAAIKAGIHPKDYTEKSIANFMKQQKAMGWSYNWSRMIKTSDPEFYKWDQWIFLKMLEKGIAYRKNASVNWCSKCNTVLANEQVVNGCCWRHEDTNVEIKHLEQWFFRISDYADELLKGLDKIDWPENAKKLQKNWIGKSFGAEIKFEIQNPDWILSDSKSKEDKISNINGEKWPIFTTRADTIFGVTFMVVSAQHPRLSELVTDKQKKSVDSFLKKIKSVSIKSMKDVEDLDKEGVFTGSYAINPMTNEKVPVYAGNFVLADYGSGMVMAVPAHDHRDFEFAKKYGIPIKWVVKSKVAEYTVIEKSLSKDKIAKLKDYGSISIIKEDKDWGKFYKVSVNLSDEEKFIKFLESNLLKTSDDGGAWYADSFTTTRAVVFPNKHFILNNENDIQDYIKYGLKLGIPKNQLEVELQAYTDYGILINSQGFNDLESDEAIEHIVKALESKKLGKKTIQYKLRDWLISRQRYWGTPIPVVYCDKCKENVEKNSTELSFYDQELFENLKNGLKTMETRALNPEEKNKFFGRLKERDYLKCVNKTDGRLIYLEILNAKKYSTLSKLFEDKNSIRKIFPNKNITSFSELEKCYSFNSDYLNKINKNGLVAWEVKKIVPGIVPVPESQLPIKLPDKVKFGEGNPLTTNKDFVNTKCPKCKGVAKRETDTMDTFVNSSWYYLRYTDPKNSKKIFDEKKVAYWCPIDQYIGGPEHITMHLIYIRFYAKFLRDLGIVKFDEPALRYFTQGIVHGSDGEKMSKSRGNVVEPLEMIEKYGADTLRLALVSFASPENSTNWDEKIVLGSHKLLNKIFEYFSKVKFGKTDARIESKINKTIKEITIDIENFKHNLAVIKLRMLFDYFQDKQIDKKTAEKFITLLSVYCPFISEELWGKIGEKGFISLAKWPVVDEKKIDLKMEKQEEEMEKTISDVLNILKIIKEKQHKEGEEVYLYVLPNEKNNYNEDILNKRINKKVKVFAVNDKAKYDPQSKSSKAKPGRPAIFVE